MTTMNGPTRRDAPTPAGNIADSPLFWICLFSGTALLILALMGPRYAKRQANIEVKYQARQQGAENLIERDAAKQQGQGESPPEVHEPQNPQSPDSAEDLTAEYSSTERLIVSLRPLVLVLGAALLVSAAMLAWLRRSGATPPTDARPGPLP